MKTYSIKLESGTVINIPPHKATVEEKCFGLYLDYEEGAQIIIPWHRVESVQIEGSNAGS